MVSVKDLVEQHIRPEVKYSKDQIIGFINQLENAEIWLLGIESKANAEKNRNSPLESRLIESALHYMVKVKSQDDSVEFYYTPNEEYKLISTNIDNKDKYF